MRKISVVLFVFTLLLSCNCKEATTVKIDKVAEIESINGVLDSWHVHAAETNFDSYFGLMSEKSVFVGTDAREVWNVQQFKDFSKPYFDRGQAWSFKGVDRNIYLDSDGEIAWFDELLDTWMGVCRGSGVLKKAATGWEIEHYVLSLTVPNDNIQEVIKINKVSDSIFLSKVH